jgi:hypothetical protein
MHRVERRVHGARVDIHTHFQVASAGARVRADAYFGKTAKTGLRPKSFPKEAPARARAPAHHDPLPVSCG